MNQGSSSTLSRTRRPALPPRERAVGGEDGFLVHSSVCQPDLAARLSKVQVVSQPQDSFAAPIR